MAQPGFVSLSLFGGLPTTTIKATNSPHRIQSQHFSMRQLREAASDMQKNHDYPTSSSSFWRVITSVGWLFRIKTTTTTTKNPRSDSHQSSQN
jgi:hypothetical protein